MSLDETELFLESAIPLDAPYVVPELPANYLVSEDMIEDNRLGQLLVRARAITHEQLGACLDEQLQAPGKLLGDILLERELVTADEIARVLQQQLAELQLGQILVRTKTISEDQLEVALVDQENTGELLGSVLIGFGFCSPEQIQWALEQQKNKD